MDFRKSFIFLLLKINPNKTKFDPLWLCETCCFFFLLLNVLIKCGVALSEKSRKYFDLFFFFFWFRL